MRTLKAKDIAPFTKIIAKMELKDTIKNMFTKTESNENTEGKKKSNGSMVSELIWGIVENYHKCESEFFAFLAGLEGKTTDEIAELPISDFIDLITSLFSEENISFFKSAAK
jgi:hypothetical protein